jgi:hypothetical protein
MKATDSVLSEIEHYAEITACELRKYIMNDIIKEYGTYDEVEFENHSIFAAVQRIELIKNFFKCEKEKENGL